MTIKSLMASLLLVATMIQATTGYAQNGFRSESDMLRQAAKYFNSGDFARASELYAQAVSNNPENSEYNYRLGVSIVESGKDKVSAIRFLELARLSPQTNPDVDLYLGIALQHAARFDDSVTALERFLKSGVKKEKQQLAENYIHFGRNALEAQSDLSADRNDVITKKEVSLSDLASAYQFPSDAGRIMKVPSDFEDKNCEGAFACEQFFLSKGGTALVMARQMGKGRGLDLFIRKKTPAGKWSEPVDMGPKVNTSADEAYATLSPDGNTLYFSSNGASSTGGFDVFRSEYDVRTGSWTAPASLGFPVNSPGNDIYYAISDDKSRAFFASDRESSKDRYMVYDAAVSHDTRRFFVIEGTFTCPQCMDQTSASITVMDPETMGAVAHVRSRPGTDTYRMKLYVPGNFIYQVEADGFSFAQQLVDLEERGRGTVFQEIILRRNEAGAEKLVVVNRYDEEDAVSPLAAIPEAPVQNEPVQLAPAEQAPPVATPETKPVEVAVTPVAEVQPAQLKASEPAVSVPAVAEPPAAPVSDPVAIQTSPVISATTPEPAPSVVPVAETIPVAVKSAEKAIEPAQVATQSASEKVTAEPVSEVPSEPVASQSPAHLPTFRVQIGAYYSTTQKELKARLKGRLPEDTEFVNNPKGYIQVTSGNLPDYESAKFLKEKLIAAGFSGAFVVVFEGEQQAVLANYVKPDPVAP